MIIKSALDSFSQPQTVLSITFDFTGNTCSIVDFCYYSRQFIENKQSMKGHLCMPASNILSQCFASS
jgi:hypothetical protein